MTTELQTTRKSRNATMYIVSLKEGSFKLTLHHYLRFACPPCLKHWLLGNVIADWSSDVVTHIRLLTILFLTFYYKHELDLYISL